MDAPILSRDSCYRDATHLPFAERVPINFDDPQAIEPELPAQPPALRAERFVPIEGLVALYGEDARLLARRMERDIRERGRESVIEQYEATVRPMAELSVRPTRALANLVVSGCELLELSAQMVLAPVAAHLPEEAGKRKPARAAQS